MNGRSEMAARCSVGTLVVLSAMSLWGCGGGGSTAPLPPNPVPMIAGISPNTATRGGKAFTLTVSGSNFVAGVAVQWNGSSRSTTFINGSQVTAQIGADDISVAGTDAVTVFNPVPGGGSSTSAMFTVPCVIASAGPVWGQTSARLGAYYFDGWSGRSEEGRVGKECRSRGSPDN